MLAREACLPLREGNEQTQGNQSMHGGATDTEGFMATSNRNSGSGMMDDGGEDSQQELSNVDQ